MAINPKNVSKSKSELQRAVPSFKLKKSIGEGGNGVVYSATDTNDGTDVAIKFFLNVDPKRFTRFVDEVLVVTTRLKGNQYVVPILHSDLNQGDSADSVPWYTMPIAVPLRQHAQNMTWVERLAILAELAAGLDSLHKLDVAHRDLKPENMLFLDGRPRFGDFGIAKFPENAGVTTATEPMGPAGYIAPEMLSNAASADARMADIYSFGKSIWSLLTGTKTPFVGQYTTQHSTAIQHYSSLDFVHESLDALLRESTNPNPAARPSAAAIALRLGAVIAQQGDFEAANSAQWDAAEQDALILPGLVRARWEGIAEIAEVVSVLSRRRSLNHCFFPDGGGQDVTDVQICEAGKMLSLGSSGVLYVVNPVSLVLERFPGNAELSYAVLETADAQPFGVRQRSDFMEELLQLANGIDYRPFDEDESYDHGVARRCCRYHKGGRFILAPKAGVYNRADNYMGDWNRLEPDRLREIFHQFARTQDVPNKTLQFERVPMLLDGETPGVGEFRLRYLSDANLQELLDLDDVVATKRSANDTEHLSIPAGTSNPDLRRRAIEFIESLTDEQVLEYWALMCIGRGDLPTGQYQDFVEKMAGDRKHVSYLFGLLGNGYLLRAFKNFGFRKLS